MISSQISMLLNAGSLMFGLGAWILACSAIAEPYAAKSHRRTFFSFGACAISLVFQIFEIGNRVSAGDYAAIEDTIRAVIIASVVLTVGTVALNAVAIAKVKKN